MVNSQEHLLIITMKGLILHGNGLNKKESNTKLFSTNLFKILVLYMCQNVGLCNLPICKVSVMLVGTRKRKKKITQREVRDRVCSRLYRHGLGGVEKLYWKLSKRALEGRKMRERTVGLARMVGRWWERKISVFGWKWGNGVSLSSLTRLISHLRNFIIIGEISRKFL